MFTFFALIFFFAIVAAVVLLAIAIIYRLKKSPRPVVERSALVSVGAAIVSLVVALFLPQPAETTTASGAKLPPYLALVHGQHAYLGSNAEGDGTKGTLFWDWTVVENWYSGKAFGAEQLPHSDLPVGTEVVVDSWKPIGSGDSRKLMVLVHTLRQPTRSGYVVDVSLIPKIPAGSPVIVAGIFGHHDKAHGNVPMYSVSNGDAKHSRGVNAGARGVLLSVDTAPDASSPFRVRITNGPHRGQVGYFDQLTLSAPSDGAGGGEYNADCRCVSLFLNEHGD